MSVEIVYNTTSASPILYSFKDAIKSASSYGLVFHSFNDSWAGPRWSGPINASPLELRKDGCTIEEGVWNCTKACQDVDQVFSSVSTLQNCMVFPQISSLLLNGSLNEAARDTAHKYGIDQGGYKISTKVHDVITGCFDGWCKQHPRCDLGTDQNKSCYADAYGQRYCFPYICYESDDFVIANPDIGGIGVRQPRARYGS